MEKLSKILFQIVFKSGQAQGAKIETWGVDKYVKQLTLAEVEGLAYLYLKTIDYKNPYSNKTMEEFFRNKTDGKLRNVDFERYTENNNGANLIINGSQDQHFLKLITELLMKKGMLTSITHNTDVMELSVAQEKILEAIDKLLPVVNRVREIFGSYDVAINIRCQEISYLYAEKGVE